MRSVGICSNEESNPLHETLIIHEIWEEIACEREAEDNNLKKAKKVP